MIYVRVELWPKGDRSRPRPMGEAVIENIGGNEARGNYRVSLSKPAGFTDPTQPRADECWKRGELEGFPRKSKRVGVWDLLLVVLGTVLIDRIKPLGSKG